jgi:hypothetical protein
MGKRCTNDFGNPGLSRTVDLSDEIGCGFFNPFDRSMMGRGLANYRAAA